MAHLQLIIISSRVYWKNTVVWTKRTPKHHICAVLANFLKCFLYLVSCGWSLFRPVVSRRHQRQILSVVATFVSSGYRNKMFSITYFCIAHFLKKKTNKQNVLTLRSISAALEWQPQRIVGATQGRRPSRLPVDSIKFHVTITTDNEMINPLQVTSLTNS